MVCVLKCTFPLNTKLVAESPRVTSLGFYTDAVHHCATICRNFVELLVSGVDAPILEAFQKAVDQKVHVMRCFKRVEVDLAQTFSIP